MASQDDSRAGWCLDATHLVQSRHALLSKLLRGGEGGAEVFLGPFIPTEARSTGQYLQSGICYIGLLLVSPSLSRIKKR